MLIKILLSLVIVFILSISTVFCQITYTTIADGNWNDAPTWIPSVPPLTLPAADSIIITHQINYNVNQIILGVMIIRPGSSVITAGNSNMKVGKGEVDKGELINYGSLTVNDLEVKPDKGCSPSMGLPTIINYGTIRANDDLHIGNNCGRGSFYNQNNAKVFVNDQIHLDFYLCNADSIFVGNVIKIHGGTVDCCGYMEVPLLDIDENSGRSSNLACTNFCDASGFAPVIDIAGTNYVDLNDAFFNAPPSETSIDDDSTFICDYDQAGVFNSLPVELLFFKGIVFDEVFVELSWAAESQLNNDYFTIERSVDGISWEEVISTEAEGSTTNTVHYSELDKNPLPGMSYYRLKQTDTDLSFSYSTSISVILPEQNTQVSVYPNPSGDIITIKAGLRELEGMQLFNCYGQNISSLIIIKESNTFHSILDLSDLPFGIFTIRTKNSSAKIVKL